MQDNTSNPLYTRAYPDLIALFWAYYKMRIRDGFPVFRYGNTNTPEKVADLILNSSSFRKDISSSLHELLSNSIKDVLKEFAHMALNKDTLYDGSEKIKVITPGLEERYSNFFKSDVIRETMEGVVKYIEQGHSKMGRILPGSETSDEEGIIHLEAGLGTAAQFSTWTSIIFHAMGDEFNIHRFLKVAASLDLKYVEQVGEGIGIRRFDDKSKISRDVSLLDPDTKSGFREDVTKNSITKNTLTCPAKRPPSENVEKHIKNSFPDLNPSENMIEGLARMVPVEIEKVFKVFRTLPEDERIMLFSDQTDEVGREILLVANAFGDIQFEQGEIDEVAVA